MLELRPETEKAVIARAQALGLSPDEVVSRAIGAVAASGTAVPAVDPETVARRLALVREHVARMRALPVIDGRPIDVITAEVHEQLGW